jgi:hypothetical protein
MKKLVKKPKEAENGYWKWDKETFLRDDWDFHWLGEQKDKCKAVLIYECSREVIQLRELANDFRFKNEEWPFENQLPLDYFPDKPSKQIPSGILDLMTDWADSISPLKSLDLKFIGELHDNGFLESRTTNFQTFQLTQTKEIAAFEIDWKLGAGQIKKQFNEWADVAWKRFQKAESESTDDQELGDFISRISYEPEQVPRIHCDTCLKKLGAYRLQMAYESWNEAAIRAIDTLGKDLYQNQADWIEANKSAKETINHYAIWP